MPEVYRIEYPCGGGVYYSAPCEARFVLLMTEYHQDNPIDHPRPTADGMGQSAWADMIFGFSSLPQMRAWFDGTERLFLSQFGALCSKYFARGPIISGRKQVAFYRKSADLIWQKPLNHF